MPKSPLYVPLSGSKLRVRKEQRDFVDRYTERHGVSTAQAIRDMIAHCMDCPFFRGNNPTVDTIPQSGGRV